MLIYHCNAFTVIVSQEGVPHPVKHYVLLHVAYINILVLLVGKLMSSLHETSMPRNM